MGGCLERNATCPVAKTKCRSAPVQHQLRTSTVHRPPLCRPPQAYLEQVRASPDCWRLCLARFEASQYLEVRFWCAQTLSSLARSSYAQLPPEARNQLKRALVAAGTQPAAAQLPSFLRNKIAQAVVAIAAHEYPDQWPSFFQARGRGRGGAAAVACSLLRVLVVIAVLCFACWTSCSALPTPQSDQSIAADASPWSAGPAGHSEPGAVCSGHVLQVGWPSEAAGAAGPQQLQAV